MSNAVLEKELVVDYKIPAAKVREGNPNLLRFDQYLFFTLRNHLYHPRSLYTSPLKDMILIRLTFKKLDEETIIDLEVLLELKPGQLKELVQKAKESISQRAEEPTLIVDLDVETEVAVPTDEKIAGIRFFELTELSHTLLKKAINAYSTILHNAAYRKDPVALAFNLEEVKKNRDIALQTLQQADLSSLDEMEYIVQTYSNIVKELYKA